MKNTKLPNKYFLIDAHAHLDKYEKDLESVLQEIERNKILTISVSMDIPSYQRNLEISTMCEFIQPAFGIHPWNATSHLSKYSGVEREIKKSLNNKFEEYSFNNSLFKRRKIKRN